MTADSTSKSEVIALSELLGRHVLVGLTHESEDSGQIVRREQFHGDVEWVDEKKGIGLALRGNRNGEHYVLPPDTRSFRRGPGGEFRLRETGEVVSNPDFLATWIVVKPAHDDNEGKGPQKAG